MALVKVADLTKTQKAIVESVPRGIKFLQGAAGTGKTTTGVRRMLRLLSKDKVFANEILVLVPQRVLAQPYTDVIDDPQLDPGGRVTVGTFGSLSRNMVELFFPLVAADFGFTTAQPPTFLSLETAQYHMARAVGQMIEQRAYFDSIAIARNRLYSQIIDNLNKAALVGLPHTQIAERLTRAWGGKDRAQVSIYEQAQECANVFRHYCIAHQLVDFSLQVEMFRALWELPPVREYLVRKYRHLILDNIEEETPVAHDILLAWLPQAESGLVIADTQAGYRRFLGASPSSAARFGALAKSVRDRFETLETESFVTSPALRALGAHLAMGLGQTPVTSPNEADPRDAIAYGLPRYHTEMLAQVVETVAQLVNEEHIPPMQIAVLAPFLSDSLRYTLVERLTAAGVPVRTHRPSRALREEPAVQALLTWAQIAHPTWELVPTPQEVTTALIKSIDGLDWVRAKFMTHHLYTGGKLKPFDALASGLQARMTYQFGELYERLRLWLSAYQQAPAPELDVFLSRLFDECLARRGYGLHNNRDAEEAAGNLVRSAANFRQVVSMMLDPQEIAKEYAVMVREGVIADLYLPSWRDREQTDAVLIAPAYTFLMMNQAVDYQCWLGVGGNGWWERLYQPLTHPYVLTRDWDAQQLGIEWTDEHEYQTRNETLALLALGLLRRCRHGVYLGFSELGEQGYEQRGKLLGAVQSMLKRLANATQEGDANATI